MRKKGVCRRRGLYRIDHGVDSPRRKRGERDERREERREGGEKSGARRIEEGNRRMSGEGEIAENGGARTTTVRHWPGYK